MCRDCRGAGVKYSMLKSIVIKVIIIKSILIKTAVLYQACRPVEDNTGVHGRM
jgi:hypothetical protein